MSTNTNTNGYPYMTKSQILDRLATDREFVKECAQVVQSRLERRKSDPTLKSHGWMSSHEAKGSAFALRLSLPNHELSDQEWECLTMLMTGYSKQLAHEFRMIVKEADPTAAEKGKVFGV